jgi:hypothetical protein
MVVDGKEIKVILINALPIKFQYEEKSNIN